MEEYKMVSLIPARGGSERIPKKNIKLIAGKPMVAWTIEASIKSKYISRTFVSTENDEVEKIALEYGAEILKRPKKYASDKNYELMGIVQQFKEHLWDENYIPDFLALLYPTSPLRTAEWIDKTFELMVEKNCDRGYTGYKISADRYEIAYKINKEGTAEFVHDLTTQRKVERRKLIPFGDWYATSADVTIMPFQEALPHTDLVFSKIAIYEVDPNEIVDINVPSDFFLAEAILKYRESLTIK